VRLAGTQFVAKARHDGMFRLDSLPSGAYTLVVEHPDYAALGMAANEQELEITEATETMTAVEALGTETILRHLCGRGDFETDRAALRVLVRTADGAPAPGIEIRARYNTFEKPGANRLARIPHTERVGSDTLGAAMFCDLPARVPVDVEIDAADGRGLRQEVRLNPHTISVVTITR
jgi:hypothetical protein